MFELSIRSHFSGAHRLRGYQGSCADQHGHNWQVEVAVRGSDTGPVGMLVDFRTLKQTVRKVLQLLDHTDLNRQPMFRKQNPTSENVARFVFEQMKKRLKVAGCTVSRVTVQETPDTFASYWEEDAVRVVTAPRRKRKGNRS